MLMKTLADILKAPMLPWVILGAIIALWVVRRCDPVEPVIPQADTVTVIIPGDSVPYEVLRPVPVPVFRDTGSTRWRDRPIDTLAIIGEYFTTNIYNDTLKDDTSALVVVIDTVRENTLRERMLLFQNRRAVMMQQVTIKPPPAYTYRVYGGLGAVAYGEQGTVSVAAMVTTPKQAYGMSYDIMKKSFSAHLYFPLFRLK